MTDHERGIEAAKKAFRRNKTPGLGVEAAISAYLSALSTPPQPEAQGDNLLRIRDEAAFLLDRLDDLTLDDDTDDLIRDWNGHVEPSIARLRAALSGGEDGK
ncbi:hypothetical protein [Rhizobium leguminosarum]